MKLLRKKTIWPYIMLSILALLTVLAVSRQIHDVHADSLRGQHLITFYDRNTNSTILTNAPTLRDAVKEAKIDLDPRDIIEPSLDEKLVSSSYYVNIYRARPVTITDGLTRIKVMTAYQTPRQIAETASLKLYPEDLTKMSLANDIASNGAGIEMSITRAKQLNVDMYGKVLSLRTQAKDISEFLNEKKLTLSDKDRISVDINTPVLDGMNFKIWREGKQTVSNEEAIEFGVDEIKDANRFIGFREISSAGVKGLKNVTYEIEISNGEVVSKKEISSVVITNPIKQIVVVGIKYNGPDFNSTETKKSWLSSAGISELDWGYVDYIVTKESNWNPNSINRSSGACGLSQALPCTKVPGSPLDPVDNLKWANNYANNRYGSWENAYNYWLVHKWW